MELQAHTHSGADCLDCANNSGFVISYRRPTFGTRNRREKSVTCFAHHVQSDSEIVVNHKEKGAIASCSAEKADLRQDDDKMTHGGLIREQVKGFVCVCVYARVCVSVLHIASVHSSEQVCCLFLYLVASRQVVKGGSEITQMYLFTVLRHTSSLYWSE